MLFYFTFDFERSARRIDGVAGHGDGLGEAAHVVGVVAHFDGAGVSGHDGLFGPGGHGAAAAGLYVAQNQRLVAIVGEGEFAVAVAAFFDGAIVVFLLGEGDFGAVGGLVLGFCLLGVNGGESHADKKT